MATLDSLVDVVFLTEDGDGFDNFFATGAFYDSAVTTTPITREVVTDISTRTSNLQFHEVVTDISIRGESGPLLVQWDVLLNLNAILPVLWNVVNGGLFQSLPVAWTVLSQLTSLPVVWNVIPNLQPLFSADIQKPTASVTETP